MNSVEKERLQEVLSATVDAIRLRRRQCKENIEDHRAKELLIVIDALEDFFISINRMEHFVVDGADTLVANFLNVTALFLVGKPLHLQAINEFMAVISRISDDAVKAGLERSAQILSSMKP